MYEEFLSVLEDYLGVKHTKISLKEEWERTGPVELREVGLSRYLHMVSELLNIVRKSQLTKQSVHWPNLYDGLHNYDEFREDYKSKFGKPAYASPIMTERSFVPLPPSQNPYAL